MSLSRRQFLNTTAGAAALSALGPVEFLQAQDTKQSSSPGEKIGIAVIGVRGQGERAHQRVTSRQDDAEILYVADVDENFGRQRQEEIAEKQGRKPEYVQDFRKCSGRPGRRCDLDGDAQSLACPHLHLGDAGGQRRLCREAGRTRRLGRPADGQRGPQPGPHLSGRNAEPIEPESARGDQMGAGRQPRQDSVRVRNVLQAPAGHRQVADAAGDPQIARLRPLVRAGGQGRSVSAEDRHVRGVQPALRLALGSQHRQRRHGQPGDPPDGHRPLVPRRRRTLAAGDEHRRTPRLRRCRQHAQHADRLSPVRTGSADLRDPRPAPQQRVVQRRQVRRRRHGQLSRLARRRRRSVRERLCRRSQLLVGSGVRYRRQRRQGVERWRRPLRQLPRGGQEPQLRRPQRRRSRRAPVERACVTPA